MIRSGVSRPQSVTVTGTQFPDGALVLVTPPDCATPVVVTPTAASSTSLTFAFIFFARGDYTIEITDASGLCDTCPSPPFVLTTVPRDCVDIRTFKTFGQLVDETQHELGDDTGAVWTRDQVLHDILNAYQTVSDKYPLFFDWLYLEDLPAGFSVTQPWELAQLGSLLQGKAANFNYGVANFTAEFERRAGRSLGWDERDRLGPANHTSPFEATDGLLSRAGASTDIPAVAEVDHGVTQLDRVTWDGRGLDPLEPRTFSRMDSRYEITKGEVYGYMWQKDGLYMLRKVRVPAAQADTYSITGSWGVMRTTSDLSTDTPTGSWGIPRLIEGQHPIGPDLWGLARRPYKEGKNVRVEHFRQGKPYENDDTVCELLPRYAEYLKNFAKSVCYGIPGPGYDAVLQDYYKQRWARDLARIERRSQIVDTEHVTVMGAGRPNLTGPPRPKLPWPFGSRVR